VQIRYLLRLSTDPSTEAADGTLGTTNRCVFEKNQNFAESQQRRTHGHFKRRIRCQAPPQKKNPASFIRLDEEDRSLPSLSGLQVLNSRTFVEGLRLTVVRGDITESKTEGIVVPTDGQLSLSGMVGNKVKQVAGPAFVDEVNSKVSASASPANQQLPTNFTWLETTSDGKAIREIAMAANVPYLSPYYKVGKERGRRSKQGCHLYRSQWHFSSRARRSRFCGRGRRQKGFHFAGTNCAGH